MQHRHHGDEQLEREQLDAGHDRTLAVVIRVSGMTRGDHRGSDAARPSLQGCAGDDWMPGSSPGMTAKMSSTYGFEKVPMMPVACLTLPSSALMSSSRVRPGWSAAGSRSVAISVKV